MKKMRTIFSSVLIRPTIYRSVTRCAIMLVLLLLWDKYINKEGMPVVQDGCFVAAMVFFGLAWMAYLRLDGVRVRYLTEEEKRQRSERKKKRKRLTGDIMDYADEHIVPFDELDEEQQMLCTLLSNLLSGIVYFIPSLISLSLH